MPSTAGSGTQTATIGTEHDLFDSTAAGTYVLFVDPNNMAAGDVLELRCYKMVLTSGTTRVLYLARFFDVQPADDMIKAGQPVGVDITDSGAFKATLKQTAGTGRAFPWSVIQYWRMDWPNSYFALGAFGIVSTVGNGSQAADMLQNAGVTINTVNLGSSVVVYVPVIIATQSTLFGGVWQNGATQSGNIDIGLMDSDGNRLVHSGSTAQGTINVVTTVSFGTPLVVAPGVYHVAFTQDNGTGLITRANNTSAQEGRAVGCQTETTGSFGIPTTWTPAGLGPGSIPVVGLALGSVF